MKNVEDKMSTDGKVSETMVPERTKSAISRHSKCGSWVHMCLEKLTPQLVQYVKHRSSLHVWEAYSSGNHLSHIGGRGVRF
eukprot:4565990-Amphidinium_carterae.1